MPKVVLLGVTPWPLPRGLMRRTGTVLDVSDDEAQELFERGLIELEQEPADDADSVGDADSDDSEEETGEQEPSEEDAEADESEEEEAPAPAPQSGKKYPALPKKTAGPNVWKEYARVNDIDIRGLTAKQEIMGHIIKVVGAQ